MLRIINIITSKYCYAIIFSFYCFFKTFYFFKDYKWPTYFIALYGLAIIAYRILFCRFKLGNFKENIFGILMFISCALSCIVNRSLFIYENVMILIIFAISFFVLLPEDNISNFEDITKIMYKFCLVESILFFIYTLVSLGYFLLIDNKDGRPWGMLFELTYFAQSCVACIGTAFFCYFNTNIKKIRIFELINIIIQCITVCLTLERGSILGIILVICILLIYYVLNETNTIKHILAKNYKKIVLTFGLFILTLLTMIILKVYDIRLLLWKLTAGLSLRDIFYRFGFLSMNYHNNYLFGATRGCIVSQWNEYLQVSFDLWKAAYEESPIVRGCITQVAIHSSVLEQLFIHGIIGLLILLAMYGYTIFIILKMIKRMLNNYEKGIFFASLFCLIAAMFDSIFNRTLFFDMVYPQNMCFFVFLGYLLRYNNILNNNVKH